MSLGTRGGEQISRGSWTTRDIIQYLRATVDFERQRRVNNFYRSIVG